MRIDQYLFLNGFAESRTEAKNLVLSGAVFVRKKPVSKPSFDIPEDSSDVEVVKPDVTFASRGGFKLLGALRDFRLSVSGALAIDIGASSGGFTDCLLQNGARGVIAVDSGSMQIKDFLRRDKRVTVIENYNARYMKREDLPYVPSLAVMDVSFISATYIIPAVYEVLADSADFVCLIKPQFEVGRSALSKGGIVKDEKYRAEAIKKVVASAEAVGFTTLSVVRSDIVGGDGNIEYLAHFIKNGGAV